MYSWSYNNAPFKLSKLKKKKNCFLSHDKINQPHPLSAHWEWEWKGQQVEFPQWVLLSSDDEKFSLKIWWPAVKFVWSCVITNGSTWSLRATFTMTYGRSNTDTLFSLDRLLWTVFLTVQYKNDLWHLRIISCKLFDTQLEVGIGKKVWFTSFHLFHRYWDLPTKIAVNKIRTDSKCSQSGARTTKFTVKNYRSSNQLRKRRNFSNDEWTYWRERHARAVAQNPHTLKNMAEGRFASVCLVEECILRARKDKYVCKTAWRIFENEGRRRKSWTYFSLWAQNEYISQFIISVRSKDGTECEPTSKFNCQLRMTLERNGYSASIINDLVFEKTTKVLQSKQKQLKKQGKGNR